MIIHNKTLITSDWHILHQNIYWQLPDERKQLTGNQFCKPTNLIEFYAAENAIYSIIFNEIQEIVKHNEITKFMHLGDFCILKNNRNDLSPLEEIELHIPIIPRLFDFLKINGISTVMIIGNHDQPDKTTGKRLLSEYFDELLKYYWKKNNLFTHYPIGYSLAKNKAFNTPNQRFFGMPKEFSRLDKKILDQWNQNELVNFHGHIHQLNFLYPLEKVTYVDACLDYLHEIHI